MILFEKGGIDYQFTDQEIIEALSTAAEKLGKKQNVLILPPDFTRFHSQAGFITELLYKYYRNSIK
ncbi:MAG: D-mannonate epimerase, partial [Melioribacteraceae bacterium]|nr:D-mannonate epimerase [Melioribacteraceae bacterium]